MVAKARVMFGIFFPSDCTAALKQQLQPAVSLSSKVGKTLRFGCLLSANCTSAPNSVDSAKGKVEPQ